MSTTRLDVVSVEEELFSGTVKEIFAPGTMGDLGITPGHAQLITTLKAGELRYVTEEGEMKSLFVSGGMMEVQPTLVTVLADTAIRADDLDAKAAEEAQARAEAALEGKDPEDMNYEMLHAELEAAKAQIQMIHKVGKTLR